MAPIVNETEVQTGGTRNAPATQPVALEVPVTVNGARTVEGSDKREPFSETTKTVLIFSHGAVIRLASSVAPGQLLFLTNENSKKEVVCQVVKSKNYRNVSGYVELEFTEPAVSFWGMRFPGERTVTPAQTGTAAPPASTSPKVPLSAPLPRASEPKPVAAQTSAPPAPMSMPPINLEKPPAPNSVPAILPATPTPAKTQAPPTASVIDFPRAPESKPATFLEETRGVSGPSWHAPETSTVSLIQEAARLQEQLSPMQFAESSSKAEPKPHKPEAGAVSEAHSKVLEIVHSEAKLAPPAPEAKTEAPTNKRGTLPTRRSTLDLAAEEVKIPAWLEPLARNAAPVAPSVAVPIEHAKQVVIEEPRDTAESETVSGPSFQSEGPAPTFGTQLFGETLEQTASPVKSGKGLLIGALAAGLVLAAAGGVWYFRFRRAAPAALPSNTPTFATLPGSVPAPQTDAARTENPGQDAASQNNLAPANGRNDESSSPRTIPPATPAASLSAEAARELVKMEAARKHQALQDKTAEAQAKKPIMGDVQLAAPMVNSSTPAQQDVAAPGINIGNDPATAGDAATATMLADHGAQPKAPVPIGGDVKPARLLHSVAPTYPALARSQRVSGDVLIDAFIDASGHVTTMKVLSGPALLYEAAKDAVRQWRYQPAMLDDKPVAMHLTVTVQFRIQ